MEQTGYMCMCLSVCAYEQAGSMPDRETPGDGEQGK